MFRSVRRHPICLHVELLEDRVLLSAESDRFLTLPLLDSRGQRAESRLIGLSRQLDQGGNRALTTEMNRLLIVDAFQQYLGRLPTPRQLRQIENALRTNRAADVRAVVLGSADFLRVRGRGSAVGFLNALYDDVLGRAPTASERRRLTRQIAQTGNRVAVASRLLNSLEARMRQADTLVRRFLRRPATADEQARLAELLRGRRTDRDIAFLLDSDEFRRLGQPAGAPATPPAAPGNRFDLTVNAPAALTNTNPTFNGRATSQPAALATVTARVDGGAPINLPFDAAGNFTFTTTLPLDGTADGNHVVRFQATDEDGNVSAPLDVPFTLDTIAPAAPSALGLTAATDSGVSNTDNLTRITTPVVRGAAEDGSTVRLFRNGDFVGQTVVNGAWEIGVGPLAEGPHSFTATATDPAGNVSVISNVLTVTLDTTTPPPTLDLALFSDTPPVGDQATTLESVTLVGIAEANATVQLLPSGPVVFADAAGNFNLTTNLVLGDNALTVRATDRAGNTAETTRTFRRDESAQPNQPPTLDPIADITLSPGGLTTVQLNASDPDGDALTFSIRGSNLPGMRLEAGGRLSVFPSAVHLGTHFAVIAVNDGQADATQTVRINVVADPVTTTRASGVVRDTSGAPIPGIRVEIGTSQTITAADGSFLLESSEPSFDTDILIVHGNDFQGAVHYPFLPTKLHFLLPGGRTTLQSGVNNALNPIILPIIDPANAQPFNPNVTTTINPPNIPGASLTIAAGTLNFTGDLIITDIPLDQPPPNLPDNFIPDVLINVFPNNIPFTTPAPLTLPNRGGFAPGTEMTLFGLSPTGGSFDVVGQGVVSQDGQTIITTSGGLLRTSWHFFLVNRSRTPPSENPANNTANKHDMCDCDEHEKKAKGASEIALHTGGLEESHNLVAYQSLDQVRSLELRYDSLRADPRPILHFAFTNVSATEADRLVARMSYERDGIRVDVPGYDPAIHGIIQGLVGGEHLWGMPVGGIASRVEAALQADLTDQPSGLYRFHIQTGIRLGGGQVLAGVDDVFTLDQLVVNKRDSIFGAGWDLVGLQEIVVNGDGSVLLFDGSGVDMLFRPGAQPGTFVSPPADFSTLEQLPDGTFRRTFPNRSVYQFNADNRLASVTDRNGNTTTYQYDATGRLVALIDPVGLQTTFAYTGTRVSSITDPAGRITLLEHDAAGNLIRITNPDGSSRSFTYDASHRMTGETDQLGRQETELYGFHGRILGVQRKDGSQQFFGPVSVRNLFPAALTSNPATSPFLGITDNVAVMRHVDPNGNVITETLNAVGLPLTAEDAVGRREVVQRDGNALVTVFTDARGNVTELTYDNRGNIIRIDAGEPAFSTELAATLFPNSGLTALSSVPFVAVGDLNGDGHLDVVGSHNGLGGGSNNTVGIHLNNGDGTFGPRTDVGTGGNTPRRVLLADLNNDGRLDLAVINRDSANLGVRLGNGDGTFGNIVAFPLGFAPTDLALGDVDGDGDLDAVVTSPLGTIAILLNTGGVFSNPVNVTVRQNATITGVVLGDFNGDGRIDAATSSPAGVDLLVGNGNGTFTAPSSLVNFPFNTVSEQLAAADLDRDGDLDLVVGRNSGFQVFLNNGAGAFNTNGPQDINLGGGHADLLLGDFNRDQNLDIVISSIARNSVSLFAGDGSGAFGLRQEFGIGSSPIGLAAGDLDDDGDVDLLAGSQSISTILRLDGTQAGGFLQERLTDGAQTQQPAFVAVADFNRDGLPDIVTMQTGPGQGSIALFLATGTGGFDAPITTPIPRQNLFFGSLRVADLDGDGRLDLISTEGNRIFVDLGTANGGFTPGVELTLPGTDAGIQLGDLNGDGRLDLVAHQTNRISVFLGNGDGTFGPRTDIAVNVDSPHGNSSMRLADVTGDGVLDVVTTRQRDVVILPGNGDGTFAASLLVNFSAVNTTGNATIAVGDLDNDGDRDIAVLSRLSTTGAVQFNVLRSNGNGTFAAPLTIANAASSNIDVPRDFDLIDLDGDDKLDAVLLPVGANVLTLLRGNGNGTFRTREDFLTGRGANRFATGDFDDDGDLDVVTANFDDRNLGILRNQTNRPVGTTGGPGVKLFEYDPVFNQLVRVINEVGHQARYQIDPTNGNVLSATLIVGTPGGADDIVTTYTYNARGQVLTETDPLGRVRQFVYDAFGRATSITTAAGTADEAVIRMEYDAAGNITAYVDPLGNRTEYEYDLMGRKVLERDALGNEMRFEYDARGNEVRRTDRLGRSSTFEYDAMDRLIRSTDPLGGVTTRTYDANGNLLSTLDALGGEFRYSYDARNRRVELIDPEGGVTRHAYDEADNLIEMIDPRGNRTQFIYDRQNRLTVIIDAFGQPRRTIYDGAGQVIAQVNELNRFTRLQYDEIGRPVRHVDAAGGVTVNEYDRVGNLIRTTDALGRVTQYEYNARNVRIAVIDPTGARTETVRDAAGNIVSVTDALGRVTQFTYDALNRQVTQIDPLGGVLQKEYDAEGNLVTFVDARGNTTRYEYDGKNRLVKTIDALGGETVTTYDAVGRVVTSTDAEGATLLFTRDRLGRILTETDATGAVTRYSYDASGNITTITDALGNVTTFEYDALDRKVREIDALGGVKTWEYDAVTNLVAVTDRRGNVTRYEYDVLNRRTSATDPLGNVTRYEYDAVGQRTRILDPLGRATQYQYDGVGRVTQVTDAAGGVERMEYDAVGNLVEATDELGRVRSYVYDALDRRTRTIDALGQTTDYAYDAASNVVSTTDALGRTFVLTYDALNRLTQATDALGGVTAYEYDAVGKVVRQIDPLGRTTVHTYDPLGRKTSVTDPSGSVSRMEYDANGNPTAIVDPRGNRTVLTYDVLNRVATRTDALGNVSRYEYDADDNPISTTDRRGNVFRTEFDALNRTVRTIDALGGETRLVYDAAGQVLQLVDPLNRATTYNYDLLGRPIAITDPAGFTTTYTHDAVGNLLTVTDPLGRVARSTYDALDRRVATEDALGNVTTLTFDAVGNVTSLTDARGNTTTYTYDALNRQVRVTDALGGTTDLVYDAAGQLVRVTDPLSRITQFTYDLSGRPLTALDAAGGVTSNEYDAAGNRVAVVDALGHRTAFSFDALNRLTTTTDPLGGISRREYDAESNLVAFTNRLGHVTRTDYDALNREIRTTDALGGVVQTVYDAASQVIERIDQLGRSTRTTYDPRGLVTQRTDALNQVTTFTHDAVGNLLSTTDPLGRTTHYAYDALNRRTATTDPLGNVRQFGYDAVGNPITATDPRGNVTTTEFDALNRPVRTTDALGGVTTQQFDAAGQVIATTDAMGRTTTFAYDPLGNRTTATDALGHSNTFTYDAVSNLVTATDALGNTTQFEYDALRRRTRLVDARGAATQFAYDAESNLTRITDASGNATNRSYDALDRLVSETNALGDVRQYAYDAAGNRTRITDRLGRQILFQYDDLNRLTRETWLTPDGLTTVNSILFTYDAASQVTSVGDAFSNYVYTYDAAGRTTSVSNAGTPGVPVVVQQFTYDAANNVTQMAETIGGAAGATTNYVLDALNRVTRITQTGAAAKRVDYSYNAAGQVTGIARFADAAGTVAIAATTYAYDGAGRPIQLTHQGAAAINQFDYTFDDANRIITINHADGSAAFTYDAIGQVIATDFSFQDDEAFSYDATGNRTTAGVQTGADNRLLADAEFDYVHDAEGNRTRRTHRVTGEVTEYVYDHRNRLVGATVRDGSGTVIQTADYRYDAFNRRVARTVDGDVTRYVYDGDQISLTFDGNSNLTRRVLSGPGIDQILAEEVGGGVLWSLADLQGSVVDVLDANGNAVNHLTYDTFGRIRSETQAAIDHLFSYVGREFDAETGLYYHRNRYYDADAGRYLSMDPTGFDGGDVNLYRYVGNNPVNLTDPYGLRSKSFFEDLGAFKEQAPALKAKFDAVEAARANGVSGEGLKKLEANLDAGIRNGTLKEADIRQVIDAGSGQNRPGEIVAARDASGRLVFLNEKAASPEQLKQLVNDEARSLSFAEVGEGKGSAATRRAIEEATDRFAEAMRQKRQEDAVTDAMRVGLLENSRNFPENRSENQAVLAAKLAADQRDHAQRLDRLREQFGDGILQAAEHNFKAREGRQLLADFDKEIVAEQIAFLIPGINILANLKLIDSLDPCKDKDEIQARKIGLAIEIILGLGFAGLAAVEAGLFQRLAGKLGQRGAQQAGKNVGKLGANVADDIRLPGGLGNVGRGKPVNNVLEVNPKLAKQLSPDEVATLLDPNLAKKLTPDEVGTLLDNALAKGQGKLSDDQLAKIAAVRQELQARNAAGGGNVVGKADLGDDFFSPGLTPQQQRQIEKIGADLRAKNPDLFPDARPNSGDKTFIDRAINKAGDETFVDPKALDSLSKTQKLPFPTAETRGNATQVLPALSKSDDVGKVAGKSGNLLDDTVENAAQRVQERLRPSNLLDADTKQAADRVKDVIQNNVKSPLVGKADDAFRDVATTFENIQERALNRSFAQAAAADPDIRALPPEAQQGLKALSESLGLSPSEVKKQLGGLDPDFLKFINK